jgi:micrococcal nuclease
MIGGRPKIALLFLLFLFLSLPSFGQSLEWVTVVRVIDGDTMVVKYRGKDEKVRLIGMDTPEVSYNRKTKRDMEKSGKDLKAIIAQGNKAYAFVKTLVKPGDKVGLEFHVQKIQPAKDGYPARLLAYVYLADGRMLNEEIVRAGHGTVYTVPPNERHEQRFLTAEREARENKRGLWGSERFRRGNKEWKLENQYLAA